MSTWQTGRQLPQNTQTSPGVTQWCESDQKAHCDQPIMSLLKLHCSLTFLLWLVSYCGARQWGWRVLTALFNNTLSWSRQERSWPWLYISLRKPGLVEMTHNLLHGVHLLDKRISRRLLTDELFSCSCNIVVLRSDLGGTSWCSRLLRGGFASSLGQVYAWWCW